MCMLWRVIQTRVDRACANEDYRSVSVARVLGGRLRPMGVTRDPGKAGFLAPCFRNPRMDQRSLRAGGIHHGVPPPYKEGDGISDDVSFLYSMTIPAKSRVRTTSTAGGLGVFPARLPPLKWNSARGRWPSAKPRRGTTPLWHAGARPCRTTSIKRGEAPGKRCVLPRGEGPTNAMEDKR